jgi:putative protease
MSLKVGKVTHYFDRISVAVIDLIKPLAVGDKIKIEGHDKEFTQEVVSMQTEHENIKKAKKGDSVGLKVDKIVKANDIVYKIK